MEVYTYVKKTVICAFEIFTRGGVFTARRYA